MTTERQQRLSRQQVVAVPQRRREADARGAIEEWPYRQPNLVFRRRRSILSVQEGEVYAVAVEFLKNFRILPLPLPHSGHRRRGSREAVVFSQFAFARAASEHSNDAQVMVAAKALPARQDGIVKMGCYNDGLPQVLIPSVAAPMGIMQVLSSYTAPYSIIQNTARRG